MKFVFSCLLRAAIATCVAFACWYFFHLPTATIFTLGQAAFFFSFAFKQPDWRPLLGEAYLIEASSKLTDEDRRVQCGGGKTRASCKPSLGEKQRKAIELDFCIRRVDSRIVKLEDEMWKRSFIVGVTSLLAIMYSSLEKSGAVTSSAVQAVELITPLTLFFLTIGLAYAEISTQRAINLSAAGL
jgi:hypothetical protein